MGLLVALFIFIIIIAVFVGVFAFNKAKSKGGIPWFWAVIGFLGTVIFLLGGTYVCLAYFGGFER